MRGRRLLFAAAIAILVSGAAVAPFFLARGDMDVPARHGASSTVTFQPERDPEPKRFTFSSGTGRGRHAERRRRDLAAGRTRLRRNVPIQAVACRAFSMC